MARTCKRRKPGGSGGAPSACAATAAQGPGNGKRKSREGSLLFSRIYWGRKACTEPLGVIHFFTSHRYLTCNTPVHFSVLPPPSCRFQSAALLAATPGSKLSRTPWPERDRHPTPQSPIPHSSPNSSSAPSTVACHTACRSGCNDRSSRTRLATARAP